MSEKIWRVLLVDDEVSLREPLAKFLQTQYDFAVDTAAHREEAWALVVAAVDTPYDAVLIDNLLLENEQAIHPHAVGIELMGQIKAYAPHTECIIFTGWGGTAFGIEALRAGAYRYMTKPFNPEELAMTIQMAVQHHDMIEQFEITNQKNRLLQTFLKVGQAITSVHTLEDVLMEVHRQVGLLMDVSCMDIILYDAITRKLTFELCFDDGQRIDRWERNFDENSGLTEWVINHKRPLLIHNYAKQKDILPAEAVITYFFDLDDEPVTQSWLGVPLIIRNKVIGIIDVQSYETDAFTQIDQSVLSVFASQVAVAIDNAKLFSRLNQERRKLEALMQSSFDAIVAIDQQKRITVYNKEATNLFGWTQAEMLGETAGRLYLDTDEARQVFAKLDAGLSIAGHRIVFKHKDGREIPCLFSATVTKDEAGHVIGQAGFVRDLREVKLLQERQQAWEEVSQAVTGSQDLDEILNLIVRSTTGIIPVATGGEFHLYKDGVLHLAANTHNLPEEVVVASCMKVGEGIAGQVYKLGQSRIVADVEQSHQFKVIDHPNAAVFRSMICVPLQIKDQILGTFSLTSNQVDAFAQDDTDLVSAFAGQAAIAIKNSQLLEEAKQGVNCLKSIAEASSILISEEGPTTVLKTIVKEAKKALKAWRASVILIDAKGGVKELAAVGYNDNLDLQNIIRPKGISIRVMRQMTPLFVEDVAQCRDNLNHDMRRDGVCATACLPLKLGERAVGVMWIQYREPRSFTQTEKEALRIYSEQATLAYDKARQVQELQHMRQAADALAGAADLSAVLTQIVQSARMVLQADSAAIWPYDDIQKTYLVDYSVAEGIQADIWQQFKREAPQKGQTADTTMKRSTVQVKNVADRVRYPFVGETTSRLFKKAGIKSFQGVTLQVGVERLGVLYVNYNRPRRFTAEEKAGVEAFADHAALALKKARLLEQVQKAQHTARVVARLTTLENLDEALAQIAEGTMQAIGCDAITLYEYYQKKDQLNYTPKVAGLWYPERTRLQPDNPPGSIVYQMLRHEKPYIVEDIVSDPLFKDRRFALEEEIVSCIAIPLLVGGEKVGVMFVNYRKPHRFTDDELQNIELFANQTAVAIRNAQLYEQLHRRAKTLEALHEANLAINSSLNSEKTLEIILQQVARITTGAKDKKIRYVCLRLVENGVSRLLATHPPDLNPEIKSRLLDVIDLMKGTQSRIGIVGRAALTGKVQLVRNVNAHPDYYRVDSTVQSALAVPFEVEGKIVVINVEHQDENAFDEDDQWALQALAAQAAIAIANAELYRESDSLRNVAEALSGVSERDDVLELVIRHAMVVADANMGGFTFWDKGTGCAGETLRIGKDGQLGHYYSQARKKGLTWRIVTQRKTIAIPNKKQADNPNPLYKKHGYLAEIGVPLINRADDVIGVMYIRNTEPRKFSKRQVALLETLAKQATVAIERANHFEEMKQIKGYIGNKTAVQWIQMASTAWGHSIRREVGIARGHVALLNGSIKNGRYGDNVSSLKQLKDVLDRIADIPIIAPLSHEDAADDIAINTLLITYLNRQWDHANYRPIKLVTDFQSTLDEQVHVRASKAWLRRAFELIVDNAMWAMKSANTPQPEIEIRTYAENGHIKVQIQDNGPGIPKTISDKLLKEAIPKTEGSRGSGTGLMLTQTILQTYNGDIEVMSQENEGTTITVMLPVRANL